MLSTILWISFGIFGVVFLIPAAIITLLANRWRFNFSPNKKDTMYLEFLQSVANDKWDFNGSTNVVYHETGKARITKVSRYDEMFVKYSINLNDSTYSPVYVASSSKVGKKLHEIYTKAQKDRIEDTRNKELELLTSEIDVIKAIKNETLMKDVAHTKIKSI